MSIRRAWRAALCGLLSGVAPLTAQSFRIENAVYSEARPEPIAESLTLFREGTVYDLMFDANDRAAIAEIVIYPIAERRFILLDPARQRKLELVESDLETLLTAMKAGDTYREALRFLIEPQFTSEFRRDRNELELTSPRWVYLVRGEPPPSDAILQHYTRFADAYARLNATDPMKLPPFSRLELNRQLVAHRLLPSVVEMTLDMPNANGFGSTRVTATSKHTMVWQLSTQDQQRIASAAQSLTRYKPVSLAEYRNLPAESARK